MAAFEKAPAAQVLSVFDRQQLRHMLPERLAAADAKAAEIKAAKGVASQAEQQRRREQRSHAAELGAQLISNMRVAVTSSVHLIGTFSQTADSLARVFSEKSCAVQGVLFAGDAAANAAAIRRAIDDSSRAAVYEATGESRPRATAALDANAQQRTVADADGGLSAAIELIEIVQKAEALNVPVQVHRLHHE